MPWVIAFEEVPFMSPLYIFEMVVDMLFALDILITLNTAIKVSEDKIIVSRKQIFLDYLRGMLLIDIVAVFPFHAISDNQEGGG